MNKACAVIGTLLALGAAALAIINPNFTPRDLVAQADLIFAGVPEPTANPLEWKLAPATQIKGKAAGDQVLSLAACNKDHVEDIRHSLAACAEAKAPAILFAATAGEEKRAYLHAAGGWLAVSQAAGGRWDIAGYAPQLDGTYAGGTDMLVRMAENLAGDPDAYVPVTAGIRWLGHAKLGKVGGEIGGIAAVELGEKGTLHLFVASSAGDRLYRPKKGEDALDDVTAAARLDAKSRRFAWLDVNRDGLADLVSWDGAGLSVRLGGKDGTLQPAGAGWSLQLQAPCTGLAPWSSDGRPGLLVSTDGLPALLAAEATGWKKIDMPGSSDGLGRVSPCIAADLDNDGYADLLLPGERASLLWRGKAGGLGAPAKIEMAIGEGAAVAAAGDFDGNGFLDVFLSGTARNTLWENDGKGGFREVFRYSGSMSYKCPPDALDAKAMDLNHDGWQDICLTYAGSDLLYHFNRGFRSFGEEGEVRLPGLDAGPDRPHVGQRALAAADLNGDGSQDLAVVFTDGEVLCCFNDRMDMPGLRLRLPKGMVGPVTASCWMGEKNPVSTGTVSVAGHSPAAYVAARYPGKVTVRYRLPGKPEQTLSVAVEDAPKDVVLAGE